MLSFLLVSLGGLLALVEIIRRRRAAAVRATLASAPTQLIVTSDSDNLRAIANDLHRRLASASARWDAAPGRVETDFNTSDLERLAGAAQKVGGEVGRFALEVVQIVDAARSALQAPLLGTHQEQVTRLHATSAAVERACTALNNLQFGHR